MEASQALLKEQKVKGTLDAGTGQNYVQFTEGESIKKNMDGGRHFSAIPSEYGQKLKLGGIASWNRSFAIPETWHVLKTIHE